MELTRTDFAPARRLGDSEILAAHDLLASNPLVIQLLNSFPEPVLVLNEHRQIVLANDKATAFLDSQPESFLGNRPGEVLHCIHSRENDAGCGTTKFCSQCGVVKAILSCRAQGTPQIEECRITCSSARAPQAMDLRVWATPLNVQDNAFTVFAIRDITDEKRRSVLERLFFHDVLNTAGGLQGIMAILPDLSREDAAEMSRTATSLADDLVEQIQSQRDMAAAERGDFSPTLNRFDAVQLISRLCAMYGHHPVASGKRLLPDVVEGDWLICSDEVLLSRVLGNLIKNALEASTPGQAVRVTFENVAGPVFTVHNEASMPKEVQLQVFQRSFSTKASTGRGIGTYSVKLFTERYLNGTVTFTSSADEGTTFTVRLRPQ